MTQMLLRSKNILTPPYAEPCVAAQLPIDDSDRVSSNQKLAADMYEKGDAIVIDVYHTDSEEKPNLHADWESWKASDSRNSLAGFVVGVHMSQDPSTYAGYVPVITNIPFPGNGAYRDSGPRLINPLLPEIERNPQGDGWLLYALSHQTAA